MAPGTLFYYMKRVRDFAMGCPMRTTP